MESDKTKLDVNIEKASGVKARYLVLLATFLINAIFLLMRVVLSVAIVAIALEPSKHEQTVALEPSTHEHAATLKAPQYEWSSAQRSAILSSFFWGYTVLQYPATHLTRRLGPRLVGTLMVLLSALASALFVPAASLGWQWACASQVLLGVAQCAIVSCVSTLLARWTPPLERARMTAYSYTGFSLGTILGMSVTGVMCDTLGWPSVFYLTSGLGLLLAVAWPLLVADSPELHRLASPGERAYIASAIAATDGTRVYTENLRTPWRSIVSSLPVWAITLAQCANGWGFYTMLTGIPSYMYGVLGFDLTKNGLLSGLPYVAMWLTMVGSSWLSDLLLRRGYLRVRTARRLFNTIGQYGPGTILVIVSFVGSPPAGIVALLVLMLALNGVVYAGYNPNLFDIASNYAGVLSGIINCVSCVMSLVGPLIVGFIVTDTEDASQWRVVFLLAAAIYGLGGTFYLAFSSGSAEPWNNPETS